MSTLLTPDMAEELDDGRLKEFLVYHYLMDEMGDIDPQYPMLRYICDRYELNTEQRYWLAFLTGATYCAPTVFYIYNEFPDYENVDVGRLNRWWHLKGGRENSLFQSDRMWIRSRNQLAPMFESYRQLLDYRSQELAFRQQMCEGDPEATYDNCYDYFIQVKYMGRFAMFLWMEAVYVVTGFPMYPASIDWKDSSSTSSRNGMCFALGWDDLVNGHGFKATLSDEDYESIDNDFQWMMETMRVLKPQSRVDVWNVETSLCAYKKWRLGIHAPERRTTPHYRYPGYYLDRQAKEIQTLQQRVKHGVDWSVLWDFRAETFDHKYLVEFGADNASWSEAEMERRIKLINEEGVLL